MWQYRAYPLRAVDGDTFELEVDLGFRLKMVQTVRLAGCDTPEVRTAEGQAAKAEAWKWLCSAGAVAKANTKWPLVITTRHSDGEHDKYGRWLASISRADTRDLATDLIAAGHAVAWDGHGPKPVAS